MSAELYSFSLFEHSNLTDYIDALRQSGLLGFQYRTEHQKFGVFCELMSQALPSPLLAAGLCKPLDKVPDNSQLYTVNLTPVGYETVRSTLVAQALSIGFCVIDHHLGQCFRPNGAQILSIDSMPLS